MLLIVLASMLLHISWTICINRFMPHETEGARRIVMFVPGLAIVLAFAFPDHELWMDWFYTMSVLSYIIGLVAAYMPPE